MFLCSVEPLRHASNGASVTRPALAGNPDRHVMAACELARSSRLLAAARSELAPEEQQAVERHLAACGTCSAELELLRRGWEALAAAPTITPPSELRDAVLTRVAAAQEHEALGRPPWVIALQCLVPAVAAALASVAFVVLRDPGCRTPLALACCGALWAGAYALAFAVLVGSRRHTTGRALARRGLLAAAGGLFLTGACPNDAGEMISIPVFSDIATAAATSTGMAFALGLVLAGAPLLLAMLLIPARQPRPAGELGSSAIYFALLAPALYLQSNALALAGLFALVGGAALGALGPGLLELRLRAPVTRNA